MLVSDYFKFFGPEFTLHPDMSTSFENENSKEYIGRVLSQIDMHLKHINASPSVMMQEVRTRARARARACVCVCACLHLVSFGPLTVLLLAALELH